MSDKLRNLGAVGKKAAVVSRLATKSPAHKALPAGLLSKRWLVATGAVILWERFSHAMRTCTATYCHGLPPSFNSTNHSQRARKDARMARHRFTDKWLQTRRATPDSRLEFMDAVCPGLWLRVSGRDSKVFSVLLREIGKQRRRTLGPYPRWSLADARREAMHLRRLADEQKVQPPIYCPRCLAVEAVALTHSHASSVLLAPAAPVVAAQPSAPSPTLDDAVGSY